MGRKISREHAMKLLYQLEFHKDNCDNAIDSFIEQNNISKSDENFIRELIYGIYAKIQDIDCLIENNLRGWKIERISKVDLSILRISVFEILEREDIPVNVSINEAIELAKKYSGKDSAAFINGILGKIYDAVNKQKKQN